MARVAFTANIQRHVPCAPGDYPGRTVREVLNNLFASNAVARGYVLDDQGGVRKHMVIFVDGEALRDRAGLSDTVSENGRIHVMQALSGG